MTDDEKIERWPWFTTARVLRMNAADADHLRLRLQAWPAPATALREGGEWRVESGVASAQASVQRHSERSEESQSVSRHSEPPTGGVEPASEASQSENISLGASIEAFLQGGEHRIVPRDGVGDENAAAASEQVNTTGGTEQLAEIFAAQGLFQQAREIYERLSLQNPEKSVYFAELIERCSGAREV